MFTPTLRDGGGAALREFASRTRRASRSGSADRRPATIRSLRNAHGIDSISLNPDALFRGLATIAAAEQGVA